MSSPAAVPDGQWMLRSWAESLGKVLAQMGGSPVNTAVLSETPSELPSSDPRDLWILGSCSGGIRGEMSFRLPVVSAIRLAQLFTGETSPAVDKISAEQQEAVIELMRQAAGLVNSDLKPRWGDVQIRPEITAGPPSWPSAVTAWIQSGQDRANNAFLEVHLSAALVAVFRAEKPEERPADAATSPSTVAVPEARPASLDLLMDVELVLTLRFGSRDLTLAAILDLTPGAVIDLDRQVEEPVDVLLDGRLVARGEVVVTNGNYGLRVTELGPTCCGVK